MLTTEQLELQQYWKVKIRFIKRRSSGNMQKRYQAYFHETGYIITTQKKLKVCVIYALRARRNAINDSIEKGQLWLLI